MSLIWGKCGVCRMAGARLRSMPARSGDDVAGQHDTFRDLPATFLPIHKLERRRCLQDITIHSYQPLSSFTQATSTTHHFTFSKNHQSNNMPFTASDICKIILAIFLPPLGVFLERGCNADFFINILLTILGYIPVSTSHSPHYTVC